MLSKAEFRGGFLALAGLLVVVYLLIIVTPGLPGELLLQSLRFHLAVVGVGLAVVLFIIGARWRGALMLLGTAAFGVHGALIVTEQMARREAVPDGRVLTTLDVLSYNVLADNETAEAAADYIIGSGADVVVVMESVAMKPYLKAIRAVYPYSIGCNEDELCDTSLYSRHPIERQHIFRMSPFRFSRLIRANVIKDGVTVTVLGVHLSKPYFDYAQWGELTMVREVGGWIDGPGIIMGDFNAAAWSDPVAALMRNIDLIPPPGYPATWPLEAGPLGVPIDNMFTKGTARIETIAAGEDSFGSNHRFLRAEVAVYAAE